MILCRAVRIDRSRELFVQLALVGKVIQFFALSFEDCVACCVKLNKIRSHVMAKPILVVMRSEHEGKPAAPQNNRKQKRISEPPCVKKSVFAHKNGGEKNRARSVMRIKT